ncbi:alpha/beta-hydrolase [Schizophyllum commune Tattone D]|nr:alpha/beta-hydrolase [Schizophyllum commune Tattone D]
MQFALRLSALLATCGLALSASIAINGTTLVGSELTSPSGKTLDFFAGIPYAEAPVGKLRFAPPVSHALNGSTFDVTRFGPACPQPTDGGVPVEKQSEDCLTINIMRPTGISSDAALPVLIWVFGGGFYTGSALSFDSSPVVAQSVERGTPVILVSFGYRLGPLGFPQGDEMDGSGLLNVGARDALLAFDWVNRNIAAFGGDASKVTAIGSSAGAITLQILSLTNTLGTYIRGAVFMSGYAGTTIPKPASANQPSWDSFSSLVGCSSTSGSVLDCLRGADSEAVMDAVRQVVPKTTFNWWPALDGANGLIPDLPSNIWAAGGYTQVPSIAGAHLDDGTWFAPTQVSNETLVRLLLRTLLSPPVDGHTDDELQSMIDEILALYPDDPALGSPYNTGNETFGLSSTYKRVSAILGDDMFHSQRRLFQQTSSKAGVPTYGYLFADPPSDGTAPRLGVYHSLDVQYMFHNLTSAAPESSVRLSEQVIDYWLSFVTSLDPNDGLGVDRPHWPVYSENETIMQLNGANLTAIPDDYREEQITSLNANPGILHH